MYIWGLCLEAHKPQITPLTKSKLLIFYIMTTKLLKTGIAIMAIFAGLTLSSCKKDDAPDTKLSFAKDNVSIKVGETATLSLKIEGKKESEAVVYNSDDPRIATVSDKGVVTGVGQGVAIITATHNKVSATCKVTVSATPNPNPNPNPKPNPTGSITGKTDLPALNLTIEGTMGDKLSVTDKQTFTFNRFPDSVEEFQTVREKVGTSPAGAILLQIMAMEMYAHNKTIGEACIRLCVTSTYQNQVIEAFKRVIYEYKQPYAAASLLKGAKRTNGYNPTEPYSITVQVDEALMKDIDKNGGGSYSEIFQTYALYLKVDNFRREKGNGEMSKKYSQFTVLKTAKSDEPSQNKYYLVFSSGDILVAPEPVSFTNPYKGLAPFK